MGNRIQKIFAVTLIVLSGVLLLSPATGWLVRLQIKTACGAESPVDVAGLAASGNDPDFQDQLAGAVDTATAHYPAYSQTNDLLDPRVAALHALALRFPNQPAIYAAAIRYALDGSVTCNRGADEKPLAQPGDAVNEYWNAQSADTPPARISAFLSDCATGERLDPDNAFFQMLRAYGLFATHRDQEAIAELIASSNKPVYNDYIRDEIRGHMKLADARCDGKEVLAHQAIWDASIFPELSKTRDLARLSIAMAIIDERNGEPYHAFVIRRAVRRIGGLMRTDSVSLIGSINGIAIAAMASHKPGGADIPGYENLTWEQRTYAQATAYTAFLNRAGHHDEAVAYAAEYYDGQAAREAIRGEIGGAVGHGFLQALRLPLLWLSDLIVLLGLAVVLVTGLVSWAIGRLPAISQRKEMTPASRWGLVIGTLTAATGTIPNIMVAVRAAQTYNPYGGMVGPAGPTSPPPYPTISAEVWLIFGIYVILGVLALAASSASASGNSPANRKWRFVAAFGMAAGVLSCIRLSILAPTSDAGTLVALPVAYVPAALLVYRREPALMFSFLSTMFLTIVVTSLACIGLYQAAGPIAALIAPVSLPVPGLYEFSQYGGFAYGPLLQIGIAAFVFLIPLLIAVCAALFGRRGRPASVAAVSGIKNATLPVACLLLLGYTVLLGFTIREEAVVNAYVNSCVVSEGQAMAALAHRPWPGRVD